VEDVTERREYERELIRARDEAEKMNRLKSTFLANMSHEIRTPLTAIIGFADILTEELPSTYRRLPQIIEQSGTRLLDTLNSVLDLSMLESGEMEMNVKVLNVTRHVTENVELMQPLATNKEISLRIDAPADPRFARLDPGALDRILSNLIGNAIKFTETGSVTVRVTDTVWAPARPSGAETDSTESDHEAGPQMGCRIDVEDTGVGISEGFLPDLFDVFKQESAGLQRSHEGSGLGLAITRHLVDQLGGTISVDSEKGVGSTFSVEFPLADQPEAPPVETPSAIHRHQQGQRVLVVEDTPETQVLLERILSAYHNVELVGTADAALQAARGRRTLGEPAYDVILLDINLDGSTSGLDLLPKLRQLPNYARTPIIATTAFALSGDRERFLEAGFDAYIGKPFTRHQVLDVIDQVLGEKGSDESYGL
jgi:signal transduction histidine kinase